MPIIPVLGQLRQDSHYEFEATLSEKKKRKTKQNNKLMVKVIKKIREGKISNIKKKGIISYAGGFKLEDTMKKFYANKLKT